CATFLLLIRTTFEPQFIETFVWIYYGAILELDLEQGNFSKENWKFNNADYDKEFIHYYCCIGECCSTGTEAEAWRFFWRKLEDVGLLELNLKHGAFFLMGEIYLSMKAVVEEVKGCCSTGAESKTCKLFFGRNLFRINANYDSETRYYCCCFGGCCSTGTDSEALKLFWKKVEDVPLLQLNLKHRSFSVMAWKLLWKELEAVALLELYRKRVNIFFGRNSFRINASYDSGTRRNLFSNNANYDDESRINASYDKESSMETVVEGIGSCCSTGAESKTCKLLLGGIHLELMLVMISMEAVVEGIGGCCSTGADSKTRQLFSFERNSFSNNAYYDKESRYYCCCFGDCYSTGTDSEALSNANFDKEPRHYYCCFGGSCSTGTESGAWKLLLYWSRIKSVDVLLEKTGECGFTGADFETCRLFSFGRNSFSINDSYDKESRRCYCCFEGCCYTGVGSETVKGIRNCCSAGAGSEAWDNHFWSEQEAVVLLELDLKDGNSPGMKWRLIETISEARRFSWSRLGAVVLLRPNLNMAVPLEQTGSCGLY
uniref:Uncharacterized protein n=1 Tax=Strongyloides stercoralis TaxID=6248 RepID=A0AAF5HZD0_STRER